jgi:hypothetical protein
MFFVYLEFLRGDYQTGHSHLRSGLKLIEQIKPERRPRAKLMPKNQPFPFAWFGTLDDSLVFAFERLHLLAAFTSRYVPEHIRPPASLLTGLPTTKFRSLEEAQHFLKQILYGVRNFTKELPTSHYPPESWPVGYQEMLKSDHGFIRGSLDSWLHTYDMTTLTADVEYRKVGNENTQTQNAPLRSFRPSAVRGYDVLFVYYTMATIVTVTCLCLNREMVFDEHMSSFLSIIHQSTKLLEANESLEALGKLRLSDSDNMGLAQDLYCISPLWFTTLKCRNHRIRRQAINLLRFQNSSMENQEYFHLARIAEEVVRLEEGDFYVGMDANFHVGLATSCEDLYDCTTLPKERRMEQVDVLLPKDDQDTIQLVCKRRRGLNWHVMRSVYNKSKGTWTDATDDNSGG